jgi:hypothetical protein
MLERRVREEVERREKDWENRDQAGEYRASMLRTARAK